MVHARGGISMSEERLSKLGGGDTGAGRSARPAGDRGPVSRRAPEPGMCCCVAPPSG
ncbi:MAG: hypothetical protein JOZ07_08115 [Solirubrobacterales bacterium]|nr:hypothetical protein [Solirubrobacterales bacterium]